MSSSWPLHLLNRLQPYKALGLRYKKTLRYNINIQRPQEPSRGPTSPRKRKRPTGSGWPYPRFDSHTGNHIRRALNDDLRVATLPDARFRGLWFPGSVSPDFARMAIDSATPLGLTTYG